MIVQPTSLEFGLQVINSTSTNNSNEVGLVNGSGGPITLTLTAGTGPFQTDFHVNNSFSFTNNCTNGLLVVAGGSCELFLDFQPAAPETRGQTGEPEAMRLPGMAPTRLAAGEPDGHGSNRHLALTNPLTAGNDSSALPTLLREPICITERTLPSRLQSRSPAITRDFTAPWIPVARQAVSCRPTLIACRCDVFAVRGWIAHCHSDLQLHDRGGGSGQLV